MCQALKVQRARALRDRLDESSVIALHVLDSAPADDWEITPDVCPCGTQLGLADHLWCEACARDRGQR